MAEKKKITVIHISGTPGSGKTTLGDLIQKTLNKKKNKSTVIYDTDSFITKEQIQKLKQVDELEKKADLWYEMFEKFLVSYIEEQYSNGKRCFIFTGILEHYCPLPVPYNIENIQCCMKNYDITLHKYFIEISPALLCYQFYTRFFGDGFASKSSDFWKHMAYQSKGYFLTPDSLVKSHIEIQAFHQQLKYIKQSQQQLAKIIPELCL